MLGVLGSIPDGAAEPRGCELTLHPRGEGGDGGRQPLRRALLSVCHPGRYCCPC